MKEKMFLDFSKLNTSIPPVIRDFKTGIFSIH